jgi:hypothetical protein
MNNRLFLTAFTLALTACSTASPCDAYVEAQCECISADDCDDLKKTYEDPTPDDDEECSAGLDIAEDNAESCDTGGATG